MEMTGFVPVPGRKGPWAMVNHEPSVTVILYMQNTTCQKSD